MFSLLKIITEEEAGKYTDWEFDDVEPWMVDRETFIKMIDAQEWDKWPLETFENRWLNNKKYYRKGFNGIKRVVLKDRLSKDIMDVSRGIGFYIEGQPKAFLLWDHKKDLDVFVVSPELRGKGIGKKLLDIAVEKYGVKYKNNLLYRPSASLIWKMEVGWAIKNKKEIPEEVLRDYYS